MMNSVATTVVAIAVVSLAFAAGVRLKRSYKIVKAEMAEEREREEARGLAAIAAKEIFDYDEWISWVESAEDEMRVAIGQERQSRENKPATEPNG